MRTPQTPAQEHTPRLVAGSCIGLEAGTLAWMLAVDAWCEASQSDAASEDKPWSPPGSELLVGPEETWRAGRAAST